MNIDRMRFAARIYNNNDDPHPTHTIARELDATTRTAERLVAKARALGLITRTSRTGRPPRELVHGTTHGYYKHRCRCGQCRAANTEDQRRLRYSRFARKDSASFVHGAAAYCNWGCRCDVCSSAWSKALKARRALRKKESA